MKRIFKLFVFVLFLSPLASFPQFIKVNVADAQKKLDAMQIEGKDVIRMIDEKAQKLDNGDVITTAVCFCDSMTGGTSPTYNYFSRRYGLITKSGKKWDPVYENIIFWENDQYLVKYHDFGPVGKYEEETWYALVDRNLKVLQVYMEDGVSETYFTIKKGGKYGTTNSSFDEVLPFVYDSLSELSLNQEVNIIVKERVFYTYAAKGKDKWGLITTDNDTIIPFAYDYLGNSNRGWMVAKNKGKWGVIGLGDTIALPFVFDSIYGGYYMKGKKWAVMPEDYNYKNAQFQYDELAFNPSRGRDLGRVGTKWHFVGAGKIKETDTGYDGYYFDADSGPFTCIKNGDMYAIYDTYKGFVSEFIYSKIVDVLYERGQEYTDEGYLRRDYPIYRFKVIENGKEVEFTIAD